MPFVRAIGRWTMTALVINCIIGNAIFGLPSEVTRLVGRASPIAMIFGELAMGIIMACLAEVASQFSEPGGIYLYVRTAFGRFAGMQAGWFYPLDLTWPAPKPSFFKTSGGGFGREYATAFVVSRSYQRCVPVVCSTNLHGTSRNDTDQTGSFCANCLT
jgi:hypothetical protein